MLTKIGEASAQLEMLSVMNMVLMVVWCKMMKIKMKIRMMILLLILDIVTSKDIAELQAGVDRSPQAQAWYKLAFEGLHGRDENKPAGKIKIMFAIAREQWRLLLLKENILI